MSSKLMDKPHSRSFSPFDVDKRGSVSYVLRKMGVGVVDEVPSRFNASSGIMGNGDTADLDSRTGRDVARMASKFVSPSA